MGILGMGRHRHRSASRQDELLRAVILGFVAVVVLEAWIAWSLRVSAPSLGPLPQPNGYDDLVRASSELQGAPPPRPAQFSHLDDEDDQPPPTGPISPPGLSLHQVNRMDVLTYLDANTSPLYRARLALSGESRVPVKFVRGYAQESKGLRNTLTKLAELFQWEAWLAESEDRQRDASRADLDLVRMGIAVSYGGLESDAWFGYDLINGGLAGLRRRLHRMEIEPCLEAIKALDQIDEKREPYSHVIARQKQYDRAEGWRVAVAIVQLTSLTARRTDREMSTMADEVVANLRLARIELALRVYRIRFGSDPETLNALVPGVCATLPFDPFGHQPFHYKRTPKGHSLYSVGPDNHDDEGAKLDRNTVPPAGDLSPTTLPTRFEPIIAR
jgi:hypothetical protein